MTAARAGRVLDTDALREIRVYPTRSEHHIVGLMSGTSADGIDAVLVEFAGEATSRVLRHEHVAFDAALRAGVLEASAAPRLEPEALMRLDAALGEHYAAATLQLIGNSGLPATQVDAIGLHGQTIRHIPRAAGAGTALSWQIGSAAIVAERTGLPVVSDFRSGDTAAGGEGAPLVPIADWWLFRSPAESRVLLNLGGMANLTWLAASGGLEDVIAFDTGPGNSVMDGLVALATEGAERFDRNGTRAAAGRVAEPLLAELMGDPFFALAPPRSTGRERFGAAYVARVRERALAVGLSDDDAIATATELTAASVAHAIEHFVKPLGVVDALYASGGGARNHTLLEALARRLAPVRVQSLEALGVATESKEALAFALLAHRTLLGLPGNVPSATGAARATVLGRITPGRAR
ncbi:MAG: anhydro-N-acetylmuramic acid kinase [Candidatus Eisenbacteria bacterium]|uniref:Anhydro-N-acetylmuramic acid kinase n=1 Tax=Eiseniibacteriota bacterium TaxID=2212470 RepID=A0A849SBL4_UNCEI|nr:anhydro-N-acetylmuramic acid kinase [Candidatus Eisenbacteria bacterium]